MNDAAETMVLWCPVGQAELKLMERNGWRAFPPRPPHQHMDELNRGIVGLIEVVAEFRGEGA